METRKYRHGFKVATHEAELKNPLGWKKSRILFILMQNPGGSLRKISRLRNQEERGNRSCVIA